MKLCLMKQEVLETAKLNLIDNYQNYYDKEDNSWFVEEFGANAFIEYKEVPDFNLAPLDKDFKLGEIDYRNCKIIYENLKFLTEVEACDERLWAGLSHTVFYSYLRKRWGYDIKVSKDPKKEAGEIKTRFFYEYASRAGFFRNSLSKCWWVGRLLYDEKNTADHFWKLDVLGWNDLNSKITEVFYNNTFVSNPEILDGLIEGLKYFKDREIKLTVKENLRPAMQHLNKVGGGIILDCLSKEDIADIVINKILETKNMERKEVLAYC